MAWQRRWYNLAAAAHGCERWERGECPSASWPWSGALDSTFCGLWGLTDGRTFGYSHWLWAEAQRDRDRDRIRSLVPVNGRSDRSRATICDYHYSTAGTLEGIMWMSFFSTFFSYFCISKLRAACHQLSIHFLKDRDTAAPSSNQRSVSRQGHATGRLDKQCVRQIKEA